MRTTFLLTLVLISLFTVINPLHAQFRPASSGLLIGGGAGTLDNEYVRPLSTDQIGTQYDETYNYDLHIGYRFRLEQNNWLFWDLDALAGIKSIQKATLLKFSDIYVQYQPDKRHLNYFVALSPSVNFRLYKKLYAGLGIEPTLYFYQSEDPGVGADLPAVIKLGLNFKSFSLEGSAKVGLIRHSVENIFERNRKKEFQLAVYIPIRY